jgi:hypothetical protein
MQADRDHKPHPLEGPRIATAFAVVFGGCGIGFSLMIAKTFVLFGLCFSIASALAILWLYWERFRIAYNALRSGGGYAGASAIELFIIIILLFVSVPLAGAIYIVQSKDNLIVNRAFLQYADAHPDRIGDSYPVKVQINNVGNLIAKNTTAIVAAWVSDKLPQPLMVEGGLSAFVKFLDQADRQSGGRGFDVDPTQGQIIHALRLDTIHSFEDLRNSAPLLLSKDQWVEIATGSKYLVILYVERYDDDAVEGYWQVKGCVYYLGNTNYRHDCAPNKTEPVSKKRG